MNKTGSDITNAVIEHLDELLAMARAGDVEAVWGLFETALNAAANLQSLSHPSTDSAGQRAMESFAAKISAWPVMIPAIEEKRPAAIRDALPRGLASKMNIRIHKNPTGAPRKFEAGSRAGFAEATYHYLLIGQSLPAESSDPKNAWWIVAKSLPEFSTHKDSLAKWTACGVYFWESQEFHRERFPSKLIDDTGAELSGKGISWEAAFRNILKNWLRHGFEKLANGNEPPH